ncbi:GT2 family glycosyltransferase [Oxalobacteraceae bacterium GrIS 1.11]
MHDGKPKVWIVLVNWNGWRDSLECLESVFRQGYPNFGVILCDNASADGSVEAVQAWASGAQAYAPPAGPLGQLPPLPKPLSCAVVENGARVGADTASLLIVRTGGNLGFAGGNNVGIRIAMSDPACQFIWLLNNDTVVDPACLGHMVETASADPAIGMTGSVNCFYSKPDVVQALGGGAFSVPRVAGCLHGNRLPRSMITPAVLRHAQDHLEWVSGASMLVSRHFVDTVGEMEERYFLYFEEIDWAMRAKPRFRLALSQSALLFHKAGSATGEQTDNAFATYTQCRSRFKLYRKLRPWWLPACYVRAGKEFLLATIKGHRTVAKAIFRASRDDLFHL